MFPTIIIFFILFNTSSIFSLNINTKVTNKFLLPLRSELELFLDYDSNYVISDEISNQSWYTDIKQQRDNSIGREAITTSINNIQRFMLQLDRSDGRIDFTTSKLAIKYYDFIATCLRTKGKGWTAVIGPMEYIGLKFNDHIINQLVGGQVIRIINICSLTYSMCSCLLDLNLKDNTSETMNKIAKFSNDDICLIIDLNMVLIRIAIRYAIFQEEFENHEKSIEPIDYFNILELSIQSDDINMIDSNKDQILSYLNRINLIKPYEDTLYPSMIRLNNILQYDLHILEDDMPIKGSNRVLIPKILLKTWIENNQLQDK